MEKRLQSNLRCWLGLAAGAGLFAWAAGAAADETAREARTISQPFQEVRLEGDFDLQLTQGDAVSLVIEAPREDLARIRSDVSDGVLTLRRTPDGPLHPFGWFSRHAPARVLLSARSLDRLVLDGSGNIHAGAWADHALEVRISGSGDAQFDRLSAARFDCVVSGSGDVRAAGAVDDQSIRITGSGRYRAPDMKSGVATVSISGSGEVELWVESTLDARIEGSGDVRYYGAPAVTQSVSGIGNVIRLGPRSPS